MRNLGRLGWSVFFAASMLLVVPCRVTGQGVAPVASDVEFTNGTVSLSGTVIAPAQPGVYPAIVFLHGSGPATREGARPYAEYFAKLGLVSLIFDKRGSGASGGAWVSASLDDLANDAIAALRFLQSRSEVDPKRIGFWGVSQAGWVATHAASKAKDVASMVITSGGGASPRESELFSYETAFTQAGLAPEEIAEGLRVVESYFNYLATGREREALVSDLERYKLARWYKYAQLDQILPSEQGRQYWSWVADWDPMPEMKSITCPTLLMFGDRDSDHPTELAVNRWRLALHQAGNDNFSIMVFPGAGHGVRMRDSHKGDGKAPFADGYHEAMVGWLWLNVVNP